MKFLWFIFAVLIHGCACPGLAWTQASSKVVQVDQASGVSSTPNYWKSGDAEVTLTGVAAYADAAGAKPTDCTGGSPAITVARSTTAPMYDKQSWLITKPASNVQGQGVAFEFDVDNGVASVEMMDLMFDYIVGSGTFAAGSDTTNSDLMVYLYDVTAGKLIEPYGGSKLYTSSATLKGDYRGWFQSTLGSKKYRVCLHQATTSASAYTLKVDAGKVQKSRQVVGTIITDWQSYTPILTNAGNATITQAKWMQVGPNIHIEAQITMGSSLPTGTIGISAPVGKIPVLTGNFLIVDSSAKAGVALSGATTNGSVRYVSASNSFDFLGGNGQQFWNATTPFTWANGDTLRVQASYQVQGWSAGAQLADGYDGRVIAARYTSTSTAAIPNTATVFDFGTKTFDETNSVTTGSGWKFTAPSSGYYRVTANINYASSASASRNDLSIRKNGSIYKTNFVTTSSVVVETNSISEIVQLNAGEYVDIVNSETVDGGTYTNSHSVLIEKLSGSAFMTPLGPWETHYAGTAGDAIGTTDSLIKFTTKVEDTFGSYNPATGLWTAKGPAFCGFAARVGTAVVNLSTSQNFFSTLYKNGNIYRVGNASNGNGTGITHQSLIPVVSEKVNTGDTYAIYARSSVATTAGTAESSAYFTVSCRQSGN